MLLAQPGGRAHTHVFWLGLAGIAVLLAQIQQVGWFILPSLALFAALVVVVTFDVEFFLIPDGPLLFLFGTGVATTLVAAPRELPARLGAALAAWASCASPHGVTKTGGDLRALVSATPSSSRSRVCGWGFKVFPAVCSSPPFRGSFRRRFYCEA